MSPVQRILDSSKSQASSGRRTASCTLLLTGLLLLLLGPGCMVNRLAANRVLAAPNHQQRAFRQAWGSVWTNVLARITTNQLVSVSIPVGPPHARLQVLEVPPGDYHSKFVTQLSQAPNGKRAFSLNWETEPRDTFTPLPTPVTIVVLHGYGMMKEAMAPWVFLLAQSGFRVLAVDLRGHGESTGAHIGFGKYETIDLQQILDTLIARGLCDARVGVLGLSYGGTLGLNWAARDPRINAVVAIAPYNQPDEAIVRFAKMEKVPIPKSLIRGAVSAAAGRLDLTWSDWSAEAGLRQARQPVLLIGGGKDPISGPEDIDRMQRAGAGPTRALVLPDADHYVLALGLENLVEPVTRWFRERLAEDHPVSALVR